jgi:uncharacterized lipoprotein YajG
MTTALRLAAVATLLLAGCAAPPPSRQARADQNAAAACRHREDQVYAQQNRRELFIGDDQRDTPYAANYVTDNPARGLADEHAREDQYADCVRETETDREGGPLSPPPVAPSR